MRGQALFITMLLTSAAAAQAPQSPNAAAQTRMLTPPPVSVLNYVTQPASEVQRNYLRGGLTYTTCLTLGHILTREPRRERYVLRHSYLVYVTPSH